MLGQVRMGVRDVDRREHTMTVPRQSVCLDAYRVKVSPGGLLEACVDIRTRQRPLKAFPESGLGAGIDCDVAAVRQFRCPVGAIATSLVACRNTKEIDKVLQAGMTELPRPIAAMSSGPLKFRVARHTVEDCCTRGRQVLLLGEVTHSAWTHWLQDEPVPWQGRANGRGGITALHRS